MYIWIAALILVPICWLRSFKKLAYVSMASNVFLIFALVIISIYCFETMEEHPELHENLNYFKVSAIPLFFGIAVFDFEGNGVVLNIHASMKDPTKFDKILHVVVSIYITILCLFSSICYYSYGTDLEDMVTLNLPHDNLTSLVQILYCFGLLGSLPMQIMPVFEIYEKTPCYRALPNPLKAMGLP